MSSTGSQTPPVLVEHFDGAASAATIAAGETGNVATKTAPFNAHALPFDCKTHTAVEILPKDKLYPLVLGHVAREGVAVNEDAISFRAFAQAKGGKASGRRRGGGGCCGGGGGGGDCSADDDEEDSKLKNIKLSLGIGLFRFTTPEGADAYALHQLIGEPVGTDCGATTKESLVLFAEGTGPKAAKIIRTFLSGILAKSERTDKDTFSVYRWHIRYQYWQHKSVVHARSVDSVVLPAKTGESIVNDFAEFLSDDTATWYHKNGIPYKRAYLFYGIPGAGKTSMIQALAGRFGRNLCYLSPTHPELTDDSLKSAIEEVPDNAIVVLEDIDALFGKNREKKVAQSPLTFSGLLNALDGVGNGNGVVFILTTNFADRLDAALTRDGRVDMRVRFSHCTGTQMRKMFERFYPETKKEGEDGDDEEGEEGGGDEGEKDPEIAALEAKLAALKKLRAKEKEQEEKKKAKKAAKKDGKGEKADAEDGKGKDEEDKDGKAAADAPEPSGAAFRDALLAALGARVVSAATLQCFFVTHRKATAAEAIADVKAIVDAIDEREKQEAAKKDGGDKEGKAKDGEEEADEEAGKGKKKAKQGRKKKRASGGGGGGGGVHIHVHTAGGGADAGDDSDDDSGSSSEEEE